MYRGREGEGDRKTMDMLAQIQRLEIEVHLLNTSPIFACYNHLYNST